MSTTETRSAFEPVDPKVSFSAMEERLLAFWEQEEIFRRSVDQNEGNPRWVFYEGPPTANGMPHPGHLLTRAIKDVFLRYRTMCGYHVPRRAGWDTHGLPVEVEVEKDLGIHGRLEIEEYGVERFTRKCIDSVFRYVNEWRRMTARIGFWIDMDDAYVTFHQSYVESVWWALNRLFEQGLLYQDYKTVWWWPQGGTALSAGEVGQGYKDVADPEIYARFRLVDDPKTSLIAWTTTPWTLPSNVALVVNAKVTYAVVEETETGERGIVAEALVAKVYGKREHRVLETKLGADLVGTKYQPLFTYAEPTGGRAYEVDVADFVTLDSGTGIVHMAPGFGEDDFRVSREQGFGFLQLITPDGLHSPEVTDFAGRFCKEADGDIIRHLKARDLVFAQGTYRHDYPYCWRKMDDPLIQYARVSWFIRTSPGKDAVVENNAQINWQPAHIRDGRMGDFLSNNVDWAISRERWWGTPLPIWVNDETGRMDCVGSIADILERNPDAFAPFEAAREKDPDLVEHLKVHKPWVDEITWTKPGEPGVYRRVPEVIDCWFDAGSMPFAQWGYPHQNHDKFEAAFPADFITEAVDQTRGWWNALLQISSLMFPEAQTPHPFRNCFVMGHVTDAKGLKLSKSLKNYDDPMDMIEWHGADAVRWSLFTGTVPGQNTCFSTEAAKSAVRECLLKLWNVYSFFVTYARIDAWDPKAEQPALAERAVLDRWVAAELDATVRSVRKHMDDFESHRAARVLHEFVDGLSNWYVRRSRGRFWAEGQSTDKSAAFATLFEVLVGVARVMAPFTPFLADELYRKLLLPIVPDQPDSVHLTRFPEADDGRADDALREAMRHVRDAVSLGNSVRASHRLKVRQPLVECICVLAEERELSHFADTIAEELNVHKVTVTSEGGEYVKYDVRANFRALGPRLGKQVPLVKKALGEADGGVLYAALQEHGEIQVDLPDGPVTLNNEEVEIRIAAREGYAAAGDRGLVVILDTRVTDELRREGLAREVVSRIQRARKTQDLAYDARIHVRYEADGELAAAIAAWSERIAGETLAASLEAGATDGERHEDTVDGEPLAFSIRTA